MSSETLKAVVQDYGPGPFFFAQTNRGDASIRWVAWTGDVAQLKRLVYAVLGLLSREVAVLLKVDKQDVPDGPVWTRYHGEAPRAKVEQAMREHEPFVFEDGYTQLCVKDGETGEYFALDEYDVLYIYSDDERFARVCVEIGLDERQEELISERPHWRKSLPDAAEHREQFVRKLALEELE